MGKLTNKLLTEESTIFLSEPYEETGIVVHPLSGRDYLRFRTVQKAHIAEQEPEFWVKLFAQRDEKSDDNLWDREEVPGMLNLMLKQAELADKVVRAAVGDKPKFVKFDGDIDDFVNMLYRLEERVIVTLGTAILLLNRLDDDEKKTSGALSGSQKTEQNGNAASNGKSVNAPPVMIATSASSPGEASSGSVVTLPERSTEPPPAAGQASSTTKG